MVARWDTIGTAVCAVMPASARWGRTAMISLVMQASLILHSYVHCNIWALSYIVSTSWGYRNAGFLLFCPFLLFELAALIYYHIKARKARAIQKTSLCKSDYLYYIVWVGLAVATFIATPSLTSTLPIGGI